jgi:Family of unknown function (DUF5681)
MNPTGAGGFSKGQSGNPGGRPKVVGEVQELARQHTGEAIKTLVGGSCGTRRPHRLPAQWHQMPF